jgi:hypothetical protein
VVQEYLKGKHPSDVALDSRKIYANSVHAGTIARNKNYFTVAVKSLLISEDMEAKVHEFFKQLLEDDRSN